MRGLAPFFLLFIFVPLVELYVLIEVGGALGGLSTILLCLATAAFGAWLVRNQGLSTLNRAQQSMAAGEVPAIEMFEGAFIAFAGILLLFPGLITDIIGFSFLFPPLRRLFVRRFVKPGSVQGRVRMGRPLGPGPDHGSQSDANNAGPFGARTTPRQPSATSGRRGHDVVDADFERVDENKD